jgi:S1-C subfamily serine protease
MAAMISGLLGCDNGGTLSGSKGLPQSALHLAGQTVRGHWKEKARWFSKAREESWIGTTGVCDTEENKLLLFTNAHCLGLDSLCLAHEREIEVTEYWLEVIFASGTRRAVSHFAVHPKLDLAILKVDANGLEEGRDYVFLRYYSDIPLSQGDEVVAIGSPHGLVGTQTYGKISAFREGGSKGQTFRVIQVDAAINPGNSGGPLLKKMKDRYFWIGVNFEKISGHEGLGFAIYAGDLVDQKCLVFDCNPSGAAKALTALYKIKAKVAN